MKDERPVFGVAGDSSWRWFPHNAARCPGRTGKAWGDVANGDVASPGVSVPAPWLAHDVNFQNRCDVLVIEPGMSLEPCALFHINVDSEVPVRSATVQKIHGCVKVLLRLEPKAVLF